MLVIELLYTWWFLKEHLIETEQHLENEKYSVDADFPKAIRMQ